MGRCLCFHREDESVLTLGDGITAKTIVIDARVVIGNHGHGILRYTEELLLHLAQQDTALHFVILVNRDSPFIRLNWPSNFRLHVMRSRWLSFLGQFELAWVLRKLKPEVFHTPSFMVPLLSSCPMITTIHDLNHVVLADNYSVFHRIYYSFVLSKKVRKAKAVITVSQFSRSEILHYFRLNPAQVRVIHNGIAEGFTTRDCLSEESRQSFLDRFELPSRYILSIGNKKPHKNILRTVMAYCHGNFSLPLVLLSDFDPAILTIAEKSGKKHLIHFLRFVRSSEFAMVYAHAAVFVYPSLYEGFGFPPLEAAACGVPTVVSRKTSLPEVMGDGAIYVDPESPADIAKGIEKALSYDEEVREIVRRGQKNSKRFRWSQVARETLAVYENIAGS